MAARKTSEPEQFDEPEKEAPYLKYVGDAGERTITAEDFKSAGIEHDTLHFDSGNQFKIPLENLSEEVIQRLGQEPGFEIVRL